MHPKLNLPCLPVDNPLVLFCPLIRYKLASLVGVTKCLTSLLPARCLVLQSGRGWPFIIDTLFPKTPISRGNLLRSHPCKMCFIPAICGLPLTPTKGSLLSVPRSETNLLLGTTKLLEISTLLPLTILLLLNTSFFNLLTEKLPVTLGAFLGRHRPRLVRLPSPPLVLAHTEWNPRKPKTAQPAFICPDPQTIGFPSLTCTVTVTSRKIGDRKTNVVLEKRTLK